MDVKRLPAAGDRLPLEKSVRRHDAAPFPESGAEGRLLADGLGAGVDQPGGDRLDLRPGGNPPPAQQLDDALAVRRLPDDRQPLYRRGVVAGGEIEGFVLSIEASRT
jgi:hypothetical protein